MSEQSRPLPAQLLTQPDSALTNYLDTLLAEVEELDDLPAVQTVKEPPPEADTLIDDLVEQQVLCTDEPLVEQQVKADTGVPEWALNPFQILRFHLNGTNLVVPLISLCGIISLDRPVTQLPGQPAWNLGVVTNHDAKVVVVDTRRLLMPEAEFKESSFSHLLLIGEGNRGLAIEGLGETATVDSEAIRWRGSMSQHPWYAGILIEELSVLLDIEGLMRLLQPPSPPRPG